MQQSQSNPSPPWPLLRRLDQVAVAALVLAALVCLALYWLVHGGASGRLIEIERAPRRTVRFQVDINTADWPELAPLPGVGEALARRIVESRDAEGPFADHEALRRVRGIGPKTLDGLRPYLLPLPAAGSVTRRNE